MKLTLNQHCYFPPPSSDYWNDDEDVRDFAFDKVIGKRFWVTE